MVDVQIPFREKTIIRELLAAESEALLIKRREDAHRVQSRNARMTGA